MRKTRGSFSISAMFPIVTVIMVAVIGINIASEMLSSIQLVESGNSTTAYAVDYNITETEDLFDKFSSWFPIIITFVIAIIVIGLIISFSSVSRSVDIVDDDEEEVAEKEDYLTCEECGDEYLESDSDAEEPWDYCSSKCERFALNHNDPETLTKHKEVITRKEIKRLKKELPDTEGKVIIRDKKTGEEKEGSLRDLFPKKKVNRKKDPDIFKSELDELNNEEEEGVR